MKNTYLYLIGGFLLFLLLPLALAQTFEIEVDPLKAEIGPKESARYHLYLSNPTEEIITIKLSSLEVDWRIFPEPLSDYRVTLQPHEKRTVKVLAYPKPTVQPGPYVLSLTLYDEAHQESTRVGLPVYLKTSTGPAFTYVPSLRIRLNGPYEIDPRQPWELTLTLENLNPRNLKGLQIMLTSPYMNTTRTIDLRGRKKTIESFTFTLPHDTPPGEGTVKAYVFFSEENKTYQWEDSIPFKILGWSSFHQQQTEEKSFLRRTITIQATNNGTVPITKDIRIPTNRFAHVFTSFSETPMYIKTTEGDVYGWTVSLAPKATKTILLTTDYRPLAYFLALVVLLIIFYYILRSPIIVKKDVVKLATTEGGISQIKIIIHIKNRTKRTFENIKIIEKIPHLVNLEKDFEIGTIAPVSIHTNKQEGTLVKWELSHIDPYEERIITYKISSQLSILGGLSLAPSMVYFQDKKGRVMRVKSNRLNLEV